MERISAESSDVYYSVESSMNHQPIYLSSGEIPHVSSEVEVYFFCKESNHHPTYFAPGRIYECRLCPSGRRENWVYYCTECATLGRSTRHYAAKHINKHVNSMHGWKSVKRGFADEEHIFQNIQEYKKFISSPRKQARKMRDCGGNHIAECSDDTAQSPNTASQMVPNLNQGGLLQCPPGTAEDTALLLLYHGWAGLIYLGTVTSLIRFSLFALLKDPEGGLQVLLIERCLNSFLEYAMKFVPSDIMEDLKELASRIALELSSTSTVTSTICEEFCELAGVMRKDITSRSFGNFFLLGDMFLNFFSPVYKNPRLFLNGMWIILNFKGSPVYDYEKLYSILSSWCQKFGVELDNEVLEVIKVLTPQIKLD